MNGIATMMCCDMMCNHMLRRPGCGRMQIQSLGSWSCSESSSVNWHV